MIEEEVLTKPEETSEPPTFAFATVDAVSASGVSLILDGEEESGGKEYKCNACVLFRPGDRVRIHQDSGTIVVEFPVGAPGSRYPIPAGGSADQVLKKASASDYDVEWGDAGGIPSGGSNGQVLTKTASGPAWSDAPKELPTGGTKGKMLTKKTATNYDVEWTDPPHGLPTGGALGKFLRKKSATNYDCEWADPSVAQLLYSSNVGVAVNASNVIQSINTTQPSLGSSTLGKAFKDIYTSGGVLSFGASRIGFFGTTPIARKSLSTSATLAQLIQALKDYGLFI